MYHHRCVLKCRSSPEGSLPQGLGLLTSIEVLSLAHNEICGSIPDDCLSSPSLVSVDLSFNKLEGKVRRILCFPAEYVVRCLNFTRVQKRFLGGSA